MVSIGERLRAERERLGLSQASFAALGGQGMRSQGRYESGERFPDAEYLSQISEAGVDLMYILTGERLSDITHRSVKDVINDLIDFEIISPERVSGSGVPKAPPGDDVSLDSFVRVPLHDVELAAGPGAHNDSEAVGRHLLFRQDWMRKLGLSAAHTRLARIRGDSMVPLMSDSDLVLVDLSQTELPVEPRRPDAPGRARLFAIEQQGETRVKWVERPSENSLAIFSENSALYGPEFYAGRDAAEIRLIGRVVWWCHTVK